MLEHTLYKIPVTSSRNKNWVPPLTKVPINQSPAYTVQRPDSRVQSSASKVQTSASRVHGPASSFQSPESTVQRMRPEPRNSRMPSETYHAHSW